MALLVREDVARYLEEPHPEAAVLALGLLAEARQPSQRAQEDLRSSVLGSVGIAELIEREAVHLGDVLPIERFEGAWIASGSLHGGAVHGEALLDRGAVLPSPQHRRSLSVTPRYLTSADASLPGIHGRQLAVGALQAPTRRRCDHDAGEVRHELDATDRRHAVARHRFAAAYRDHLAVARHAGTYGGRDLRPAR